MNYKKIAQILIWIGIIIIIVFSIIFLIQEFNINSKIDINKVGALGSFFSGLIGSIWALAGILLIFEALQEQLSQNKITLNSLSIQIKEFEHSKISFTKQLENFDIQRFENSFNNLIETYLNTENKIGDTNLEITGKNYFKKINFIFEKSIHNQFKEKYRYYFFSIPYEYDGVKIETLTEDKLINIYLNAVQYFGLGKFLDINSLKEENNTIIQDNISRYSNLVDRILSFIIESNIDEISKKEATKTFISLLSKEQIILLYYLDSPDWTNNLSTGIISENLSFTYANIYSRSREIGLFNNLEFSDLHELLIYEKIIDNCREIVENFQSQIKSYLSNKSNFKFGKLTFVNSNFIKATQDNKSLLIELQVIDNFDKNSKLAFKSLIIDMVNFYWQTQYGQNVLSKSDKVRNYISVDINEKYNTRTFDVTYYNDGEYIEKEETENCILFKAKVKFK